MSLDLKSHAHVSMWLNPWIVWCLFVFCALSSKFSPLSLQILCVVLELCVLLLWITCATLDFCAMSLQILCIVLKNCTLPFLIICLSFEILCIILKFYELHLEICVLHLKICVMHPEICVDSTSYYVLALWNSLYNNSAPQIPCVHTSKSLPHNFSFVINLLRCMPISLASFCVK